MEYVYPDPIVVYLWCEYQAIELYGVEEFVADKNTGEMRTQLVGLCFTQLSENGKPKIVSSTPIPRQFAHFFENYPSHQLNQLAWNKTLTHEFLDKNNHYNLSHPKDVKRFNKRERKRL